VSFVTLTGHQVALLALLPKRSTGATAEKLAADTRIPVAVVRTELATLVGAGLVLFDQVTGEYRNSGE
jgi:DNA-binding IclR family transcriptional regulator